MYKTSVASDEKMAVLRSVVDLLFADPRPGKSVFDRLSRKSITYDGKPVELLELAESKHIAGKLLLLAAVAWPDHPSGRVCLYILTGQREIINLEVEPEGEGWSEATYTPLGFQSEPRYDYEAHEIAVGVSNLINEELQKMESQTSMLLKIISELLQLI